VDLLTAPRRVALVPWGTPLEVFLDPLGRTLDDFCERLSGGWLFGFAEALRLAGCEPSIVVSSRTAQSEHSRVHLPTGTPVTVLPPPVPRRISARPGLARDVAEYRSAVPPGLTQVLLRSDVVLVQEYEEPRTDLLAWWAARRRLPMLASFQGGSPPWHAAPVQRRVRSASVRRLAGVLVGDAEEGRRVRDAHGVPASRVHTVHNPVDTCVWVPRERASARSRLGLPAGAFVVSWHGRVDVQRKGLDVLVEAWRRVCAARPEDDVRLLLVGTGADEAELRTLLRTPGIRGVHWLATYASPEQVAERLAACDLWVSPSRHEGLAVAPLEAMASGRAVVLSDAPGAQEVAGPAGAHGVHVVPRGDATVLAQALLSALDGRGRLEDRGRAARRRVEDAFSVRAISRQLAAALVTTAT
jgi:glycosyltransferase involved in cell wall biosynthesis